MDESTRIRWPPRYDPGLTPVHVRNELEMDAAPEVVWAWIVRAPLWPTWYPNSADVSIQAGPSPDLGPGSAFRWTTFGLRLESTVVEFVPGERIAWDARAGGVDAYHAWLIRRTARGTHVLTEETQHGWLARLSDLFLPRRMSQQHQIWLEALSARAKSGNPPSV